MVSVSEIFGIEKVSVSVSKNFGIDKSIGIGFEKFGIEKNRNQCRQNLVQQNIRILKVLDFSGYKLVLALLNITFQILCVCYTQTRSLEPPFQLST